MKLSLVGDIGGTNARYALLENTELRAIQVFATADFQTPEEAVARYLASQGLAPGDIGAVCLAVAGPVGGDLFRFTNNHWQLSRQRFCEQLRVGRLLLINDFTAMALGMTRLREHEVRLVVEGVAEKDRPALVIGPGTGLGVGTLLPSGNGSWQSLPGEGGHVDLPIGNLREAALWQRLYQRIGHIRAESVLSGGGLHELYLATCELDGHSPSLASAAQITNAALAGDAVAAGVLDQFCTWLGRVAGNSVLTMGGRGGVFVVGGMIPRFPGFFQASGFARAFADKGCMSGYLEGVPVWLVTAEHPGLEGAAVALRQARP
ncbi:glucokinase [Pseudomonas sp. LRF_L74]|uniref:glucokinase n=1 Tax=Pseudomonas sp. LRF_L74 TaxID=3369422 RepID=UPI003F60832D